MAKKNQRLNIAGLGKRFLSFIIDWYLGSVICVIPIMCLYYFINPVKNPIMDLRRFPFYWALLGGILSLMVAIIYYVIIPMYFDGQTLGKKLCGIKIVTSNNEKVTLNCLVKRQFLGIILVEGSFYLITTFIFQILFYNHANYQQFLTWIYYGISIISIIFCIFSKNHQSIHDKLANTVVVNK